MDMLAMKPLEPFDHLIRAWFSDVIVDKNASDCFVSVEYEQHHCDGETRLAGGDELRYSNLQTLRDGFRPCFTVKAPCTMDQMRSVQYAHRLISVIFCTSS